MSKLAYFAESALRNFDSSFDKCPSCGAREYTVEARKYLVIALRRCAACKLMYRFPIEDVDDAHRFYEEEYTQGFTTELPDDQTLQDLLDCRFRGTSRDYSHSIEILSTLTPAPAKVFDFGCSWGFGSWQITRAGYDVSAFEISPSRGRFAQDKLAVKLHKEFPEPANYGTFDAVFSSHVLEHVPSVSNALADLEDYLRPGGYIVSITPNGSTPWRDADFDQWNSGWGQVHPNYLDAEYYRAKFSDRAYFLSTTPVPLDRLARWAAGEGDQQVVLDLDTYEICMVIRTGDTVQT